MTAQALPSDADLRAMLEQAGLKLGVIENQFELLSDEVSDAIGKQNNLLKPVLSSFAPGYSEKAAERYHEKKRELERKQSAAELKMSGLNNGLSRWRHTVSVLRALLSGRASMIRVSELLAQAESNEKEVLRQIRLRESEQSIIRFEYQQAVEGGNIDAAVVLRGKLPVYDDILIHLRNETQRKQSGKDIALDQFKRVEIELREAEKQFAQLSLSELQASS